VEKKTTKGKGFLASTNRSCHL